jgi:hypothetical protein
MANLIRLKQIESGSSLSNAAAIGGDFSQSVISIISTSVVNLLPTGLVSGSSQVIGILNPLNQFTASLGDTFATDYEVFVTTSNIIDQGEW